MLEENATERDRCVLFGCNLNERDIRKGIKKRYLDDWHRRRAFELDINTAFKGGFRDYDMTGLKKLAKTNLVDAPGPSVSP